MKLKSLNKSRGFRILALGAALGTVASSALAVDPAYQTAVTTGLGTANTAGEAILTAGAVIVVTMIVWKIIKRFAMSAG